MFIKGTYGVIHEDYFEDNLMTALILDFISGIKILIIFWQTGVPHTDISLIEI